MSTVKEEAKKLIDRLPDQSTWDDIIAEFYFRLQVDAGLEELDMGKGIPHDEIEQRMAKWLAK